MSAFLVAEFASINFLFPSIAEVSGLRIMILVGVFTYAYLKKSGFKASNITVVDVKAVGAFGRLTLAGKEGDVEEAAAAAIRAIEEISNY